MVTGDNIHTAKHIARECGILTDGGTAMEGPTFRSMPEEDLIPVLSKLQACPAYSCLAIPVRHRCGVCSAIKVRHAPMWHGSSKWMIGCEDLMV